MDSVNSNLQTGSDFWQLASTSTDCKSVENQGKNHVVYSSLVYPHELNILLVCFIRIMLLS